MQNDFVEVKRVVVSFAKFQLPRADMRRIIEDVFKLVEIHECAFDFVEIHFLDFRTAGNSADEPRQGAMAIRTCLKRKSAVNEIAGAIAQHHRAARGERRENNFAGLAGWNNVAGLRINDFNDAEIGIKMITGGELFVRERTFRPGQFAFGEAVDGQHFTFGAPSSQREFVEFHGAVRHWLFRRRARWR